MSVLPEGAELAYRQLELEGLMTAMRERVDALEAVNAGEPKRVVFEAAHSILERLSKLEAESAAFRGELIAKADEADRLDRVAATYNAYVQGRLACAWSADEELHADAAKFAAKAHAPVEFPPADPSWAAEPKLVVVAEGIAAGGVKWAGEFPQKSGLNSVSTEQPAESKADRAAARGGALAAYMTACSNLADAAVELLDATTGSEWPAEMSVLAERAEPFRYDSELPLQPNAMREWHTLQDIVLQLATGDLAGGPAWLMALRDRARAVLKQRGG